MDALLRMEGIRKSFGTVQANRGIDFSVPPGAIIGLLGENGSGKSTLMKLLFGLLRPDAGVMLWRGREYAPRGPADALAAGIGMIHQHFSLVEAMTVAENVMLGWPEAGRLGLQRAEVVRRISALSAEYGLAVEPEAPVAALSLGARQRVEILKALLRGAELLVLDEPSSILGPQEVEALLEILRSLRAQGRSVVFITHKLHEVTAVCDAVVVLRDGQVAGRVQGATPAELAALMAGGNAPPAAAPRAPVAADAPVRLVAEGLHARDARGVAKLAGVSLTLRAGEVLGIAGVDGNGQQELAAVLAGLLRPEAGRVLLEGADATTWPAARRLQAGLGYVPADRRAESLVPAMTLAENIALRDAPTFARRGWLQPAAMRAAAEAAIATHNIRASGPLARAGALSGGNQQKLALAREVARQPRVLVLLQPCWGLDPGAAAAVRDAVLALRAAGGAVLWISTETEEVLGVADEVAVLAGGRLSAPMPVAEADPARLSLLMAA